MSSGCTFASCAALFLTVCPHFSHLWIITKPRLGSGSVFIGRKIPPQGFALSPGLISTWSEQRQKGQWFREVYPRGKTSLPQATQVKPLSFFVNLLFSISLLFRIKFLALCKIISEVNDDKQNNWSLAAPLLWDSPRYAFRGDERGGHLACYGGITGYEYFYFIASKFGQPYGLSTKNGARAITCPRKNARRYR